MAFNNQGLIIAGGAPRDVLSGVAVKDIDIFVEFDANSLFLAGKSYSPGDLFAQRCAKVAKMFPESVMTFKKANTDYSTWEDICNIHIADLDTANPGKNLIEIVGLYETQPIDDVPSYDFGLSQVFVTPTGYFQTQAAIDDRAHKTITYTPSPFQDDASFLRSVARYQRLRAKYPAEWTFMNCEELDEQIAHQEFLAATGSDGIESEKF